LIVSGSNDCKIKIWSASRGECIRTLTGHDQLVRALSFDPVTGRLVSASYDKSIKVWDLNTGELITEFKNSHASHIFDVKFDVRRIVRSVANPPFARVPVSSLHSTSHDQKIVVLNFSEGLDTAMFV
jgi:F-box and WD-40 domain protein 1/11